jgi:hypothetical protein
MTKIALALAIVAIGEGAVTLHLVNRLHEERESAQTLQARVTELERKVPQTGAGAGATFIAVPTQPTVSPFSTVKNGSAPPAPQAVAGVMAAADRPMAVSVFAPVTAPLDQERMREQIKQSMERQAALMRDPEYRDAMLAQQKAGVRQANPNLARDLDLTPEQADRLFSTLAEQQTRMMENNTPMMWGEQPDPAKVQEYQRKLLDQQSANETEIKRVLGDQKFREYQEYQQLSGVRWEADAVRTTLANAGVPLDENLTKPLLKSLQEQQQKMLQQMAAAAPGKNQFFAGTSAVVMSDAVAGNDPSANMLKMQEQSLDYQAQHQKQQREALVRVLTPEQMKVIEDEHNSQLQMQRAQLRIMRAQQEAGLLNQQQGDGVGYIQEGVTFRPAASD